MPVGPSYPRILAKARPGVLWADLKAVCWVESPRLLLYALATWAIVVDILETFAHFAIATQTAPSGSTGYTIFWFWFGIKWVLFFSTALAWMWAREIPESRWRDYHWKLVCSWDDGLGPFSPFWAHAFWSLAEIPLGLAAFFIGAGFYVYPSAITLAGVRAPRQLGARREPAAQRVQEHHLHLGRDGRHRLRLWRRWQPAGAVLVVSW